MCANSEIKTINSIDEANAPYMARIRAHAPGLSVREERILANALRMGKGDSIVIGVALEIVGSPDWFGLCCWCLDKAWSKCEELRYVRLPDGGCCKRCGLWSKDDVLICKS